MISRCTKRQHSCKYECATTIVIFAGVIHAVGWKHSACFRRCVLPPLRVSAMSANLLNKSTDPFINRTCGISTSLQVEVTHSSILVIKLLSWIAYLRPICQVPLFCRSVAHQVGTKILANHTTDPLDCLNKYHGP